MKNRKGFTLVELVIVIAVIAILAGVLIGTFASVIKRANESAEVQRVKSQEIAQKADDIMQKIDNANWFSWEDFENSLAEKLTETYKKYAKNNESPTIEQIENAIKKAINEYAASTATGNTSLTEEQVKVIVENALAKATLGGVTEGQVRAIVTTAVNGMNTVTAAQVRSIVNAAVGNGLTADQVAEVIANSQLATTKNVSDVEAKVDAVITAINALDPVTKANLEAKIIELLPVTKRAADATEFTTLVSTLNSGSTIIVDFDATGTELTIGTEAGDKTLTISGNTIGTLNVNAPKATLYILCDVTTLNVEETAQNSVHVKGNVTNLTANKGRVVLESGARVENLKAAPSVNAVVTIQLEKDSKITEKLETEYQEHGFVDGNRDFIYIENNGEVALTNLTASEALQASTAHTTTNVVITNGAQGERITESKIEVDTKVTADTTLKVDDSTGYVVGTTVKTFTSDFAGGTGTADDPFLIVDYDTMQKVNEFARRADDPNDSFSNYNVYYKVKDGIKYIDCCEGENTWHTVNLYGHFDGNGVTFVNLVNQSLFNCVEAWDDEDNLVTSVVKDFTVEANLVRTGTACAISYYTRDAIFSNITIHGYVEGSSNSGLFVAYGPCSYDGSKWDTSWNVTFENCSSDATVVNTNGPASALIGHPASLLSDTNIVVNNYTFTGSLSSTKDASYLYGSYTAGYSATVDSDVKSLATSHPQTKIAIKNETLPEKYSTFSVSKLENYDHAVASLIISPNGKNETGSFTGTYMVEDNNIIEAETTISTKNLKYFDIKVNDEDTDVAVKTNADSGYSADGKTFNIVSNGYGTTYASACVRITQYDSSNNIIGISVFTLPVVNP